MKTIEEAAKEFEKENGERIYHENKDSCGILSIESFKAGVEFAQRWIPVEEEKKSGWDFEKFKQNSIEARSTLYPGKSIKEVETEVERFRHIFK